MSTITEESQLLDPFPTAIGEEFRAEMRKQREEILGDFDDLASDAMSQLSQKSRKSKKKKRVHIDDNLKGTKLCCCVARTPKYRR